jgi:LmbE family N-acetylglucosaminyl deacetylase
VGAHAFDAEVMAGGLAAVQTGRGGTAVVLHLTLGELGHATEAADDYRKQKRQEAKDAARALGGEAKFLDEPDGDLRSSRAVAESVAAVVRSVRPDTVVTHWRGSWHPDHVAAHQVTMRALLLAGLPGATGGGTADSHVPRRVLFAENWEDREGFEPTVYEDITEGFEPWQAALSSYEIGRPGRKGGFPYADYYTALARLHGCEYGVPYAQAFHPAPLATVRGLALAQTDWSGSVP